MTIATNTIRTVAFALGILLTGCTSSKSLMNDGIKYESAGMYEDAVNAYKSSLARKMSNIDSRTGLKNAGQRVLDDRLDDFNRNSMLGRLKEAVHAFQLAEQFEIELKKYGVNLYIPDHYLQTYMQMESNYLDDLHEEGLTYLEEEDFEHARERFDEIMALDEDYKDVRILQSTAVLEPKYRQAQNYMGAGEFRHAYQVYSSIVRRDSNYKDSKERMAVAREMGTFVMAIMPIESAGCSSDIESKLEAYVLNSLIGLQNPFLKLVDRENLDDIIAQQDFSLSGVIGDASALEVGNLTGAEAILVGQVIDFRQDKGRPVKISKEGFESYEVKVKNEAGEEVKKTRYKPVTYHEYTNKNSVCISFHVKLLHLETSEVLISEVIEKELVDEVHWASYSGNKNKLFPEKEDEPQTSKSYVNALRNLMNGRTELAPTDELLNQSFDRIGDSVADKIDAYLQ